MKCSAPLILSIVLLGGCATGPDHWKLGNKAAEAGNYPVAEQHFKQALQDGGNPGPLWYNLGWVYTRAKRPDLAQAAYSLSARYGDSGGQQALIARGLPVPAADLRVVQTSVKSDSAVAVEVMLELANAGVAGRNAGRAQGAAMYPAPKTCTSTPIRDLAGRVSSVETTCR